LLLVAVLTSLLAFLPATRAHAATAQISMFQDDPAVRSNPQYVLGQLRLLGATAVKVGLNWAQVAPNRLARRPPRGFKAADPGSYAPGAWRVYDAIVRDAAADGIQVSFQLGVQAPIWATGPGAPRDRQHHFNWEPSPSAFAAFVRAAGKRYSGTFRPKGSKTPLPRVSFWSIWNEPNLGFELAPQGVTGHRTVPNSGNMYRGLLNAAWAALHQTGHGNDTILIGDLGPRGAAKFGVFAAMKPLIFMQALYCVDSRYRQLRGFVAAEEGCPTTAAGSRRFRAQNPALFNASGLAVHLWARWYPPNLDPQRDPNYAGLPDLPHFEGALNHLLRVYGSRRQLPLYNTEFGYVTNPPNASAPFVSPTTAAYYLNWAEYMSWRDKRIRSFAQYLLSDPRPTTAAPYTLWASGVFTYTGKPKQPVYNAWRLPLYLPASTINRGHELAVWGCARPSSAAIADTAQPQPVRIEFAPRGSSSYTTLRTYTILSETDCYFLVHVKPPSSGTIRLAWQYPLGDPLLGNFPSPPSPSPPSNGSNNGSSYTDPLSSADESSSNATVYSRSVKVTVK
jgi:hypothetical protein